MDDLQKIIEQAHTGLESAGHVALVFKNNSERAAKGPKILGAVVKLRLPAALQTPRASLLTVRNLQWADGKQIELVTEEMVAKSNPQVRKTAVVINVPAGKDPVIHLNKIPQGPPNKEDD